MNALSPAWYFLLPGSVAYGVAMTYLAAWVFRGSPHQPWLSRKIVHVGVFTGAALPHILLGFWGVVVYGSAFALMVLLAYRRGDGSLLYRVLARKTDGKEEGRLVLLPLASTALGGLLGFLLVGNFAVVGYLACGWGDAAGEVIGRRWGRRRYSTPFVADGRQRRSVEGSLGVLLLGGLGSFVGLSLLGYTALVALGAGLLVGLVAMVAEGLSGPGTDNLWVQLFPSLVAWWLLG